MRRGIIQLAFNYTFSDFVNIVRHIPQNDRVVLEAGTPFIKFEGINVISRMRMYWRGAICADMKIADGAYEEVRMASYAGADSVTALGSASDETLRIFVAACKEFKIASIIDMIGTTNPLKRLWRANIVPDMVYIHRGRDEENSFGKIIQYKDIAKLKGKWEMQVGAAGGIDKKELQSAIFNNADIVVVNIVRPQDQWKGVVYDNEFDENLNKFLALVS